jgi:hypothetical protein
MRFTEPNKNGRCYPITNWQLPEFALSSVPSLKLNIKQVSIPVYEKDFIFCKIYYPIMKSDLKLCKKIVTDNTLKNALLNLRHDNDKIRKLCKAKILNRKISKYYYIKWQGRKLKAKFTLESAKDIQAFYGMSIDHMAKEIANEIDKEVIDTLKNWHETIDKENQNDQDIAA